MRKLYTLTFAVSVILLYTGCHTTLIQNVGKLIQGTWIRTPYDPKNIDKAERWTFTEDKLIIKNVFPDFPHFVYQNKNAPWDTAKGVMYDVKNKYTRHLLHVQNLGFDTTSYWNQKFNIFKINRKTLYLGSIHTSLGGSGKTVNSGEQYGFIREGETVN